MFLPCRQGCYHLVTAVFSLAQKPSYSQAAANRRLAEYQLGLGLGAMKGMRELLRRYPDFDDVRAAYAAALWNEGELSKAEE